MSRDSVGEVELDMEVDEVVVRCLAYTEGNDIALQSETIKGSDVVSRSYSGDNIPMLERISCSVNIGRKVAMLSWCQEAGWSLKEIY